MNTLKDATARPWRVYFNKENQSLYYGYEGCEDGIDRSMDDVNKAVTSFEPMLEALKEAYTSLDEAIELENIKIRNGGSIPNFLGRWEAERSRAFKAIKQAEANQ